MNASLKIQSPCSSRRKEALTFPDAKSALALLFIAAMLPAVSLDAFELTWTPLSEPLTLEGAEGKSYGGLTLRFAPRTHTVITTPLGQGEQDLSIIVH